MNCLGWYLVKHRPNSETFTFQRTQVRTEWFSWVLKILQNKSRSGVWIWAAHWKIYRRCSCTNSASVLPWLPLTCIPFTLLVINQTDRQTQHKCRCWAAPSQLKNEAPFKFPFHVCQCEPHDCVQCCCDESEVTTRIRTLCVYLSGGRWRSSCHNIAQKRNTTCPSVKIAPYLPLILLCGDPHLIQSCQAGQGQAPGTILTDY